MVASSDRYHFDHYRLGLVNRKIQSQNLAALCYNSGMKNIIIFDLDETVINSTHRTPNNPDGTLNLDAYIRLHNPENVAKDTLLPIAQLMRARYAMGDYIIVLTARDMKPCDYQFLNDYNLPYHKIMSRDQASANHYKMKDGEYKMRWIKSFLNLKQFAGLQVIMFDDAKPVKSALRKLFPVLCAHKVNARFA